MEKASSTPLCYDPGGKINIFIHSFYFRLMKPSFIWPYLCSAQQSDYKKLKFPRDFSNKYDHTSSRPQSLNIIKIYQINILYQIATQKNNYWVRRIHRIFINIQLESLNKQIFFIFLNGARWSVVMNMVILWGYMEEPVPH